MNKIPRERPRGRALRADAAHVAAGPAPVPAPSRSCGVLQRSREPSRLPRLPRSKGPGQAGKQKPFRAHRRLRGATTAQSLRGGGEPRQSATPHRGPCDRPRAASLSPPWAGRGRGGGGARPGRGMDERAGWPRALASDRSRRFGAREDRARAAGTRAKVLRGAARGPRHRRCCKSRGQHPRCSARCRQRSPAVPAPPAPPTLRGRPPPPACPSSARDGPTQECQGRRRRQQQQ